ncbi:hypothetical protein V6N13_094609 [Hibiscus sabdariffa]
MSLVALLAFYIVIESDSVVVVSWVLHFERRPWRYWEWFQRIDELCLLLPGVCFWRSTNALHVFLPLYVAIIVHPCGKVSMSFGVTFETTYLGILGNDCDIGFWYDSWVPGIGPLPSHASIGINSYIQHVRMSDMVDCHGQ